VRHCSCNLGHLAYRRSTGIIYIDEADKLARRVGGGDGLQRDVGGEGVQQALLRMMEGSIVTVTAKPGATGEAAGGMGPGEGRRGRGVNMREWPVWHRTKSIVNDTGVAGQPETYQVDTSNVLFILSGAFVGLDKLVKRRITKGVGERRTVPSDTDGF
jgi:ATP-dependent Clp protease ATP-binding subunit ClpX